MRVVTVLWSYKIVDGQEVRLPAQQRNDQGGLLRSEINTRIVNGARLNGINIAQIWSFFETTLDMKVMHPCNLRRSKEKVCVAINKVYERREEEHLSKHVIACREMEEFSEIEWEHRGETYVANLGPVSMDGAGGMRAYNHRICGSDTALVVQSGVANVPLVVETSRVSVLHRHRKI